MTEAIRVFKAPKDEIKCPYRNGTFLVTCDIPQAYPLEAPEIRFVTFILHPNVSGILLCQMSVPHILFKYKDLKTGKGESCTCPVVQQTRYQSSLFF